MYKSTPNSWLLEPEDNHTVIFYTNSDDFISSLSVFISEGLKKQEACIIIASSEHIKKLEKSLAKQFNLKLAKEDGLYTTLDAQATLNLFIRDGLPDKKLFSQTVGKYIKQLGMRGSNIRAFGEMVALLWQEGNKEAVIQLEELWNALADDYNFSLLCAYPDLHFIYNQDEKLAINHTHATQLHLAT